MVGRRRVVQRKAVLVLPRHQPATRGRADRAVGVASGEDHAVRRDGVDIWRNDVGRTKRLEAGIGIAEVVGKENYYIGLCRS